MTRPLVSPVIIRPKHGAFKGVALVAVKDSGGLRGSCGKCIAWNNKLASCRDLTDDALGHGCADDGYHYEHAEVRDE